MLDRFERTSLAISRYAVWCGGTIMIAAAFVIGAEVVLRKVFLISLGGADEMANYALAISTAWSLSFTLLHRAHIRVDALYLRMQPSICALLDVIALMSVLTFAMLLTWFAFDVWQTSWSFGATANTPLGTPLWIPQGLWLLGLGSFVLTILLLLARSLRAIAGGDFAAVNRIAGTRSINEDLQEELNAIDTIEPGLPGMREQV